VRVRRVVTTRAGGASRPPYDSFNLADHVGDDEGDVYANRKRLATELGLTEDRLAWMEQVHGRTATIVDGSETKAAEAGVVSAVHAGRVGARVGVVPAAVAAMREAGAEPHRIEALLGPAICGDCYEVPAAMAADVEKHVPGSACKTRKGTPGLDLRAGLWRQLADLGVGKIGVDPRCTNEDKTLFSYRRDGTTGRIAGITWIDPA
jgi:copper oxidase (laccase) domain-containing protein